MTSSWWTGVSGGRLAQGDLLPECLIPTFGQLSIAAGSRGIDGVLDRGRLIVVTQTCDLDNDKAPHVALCAIHGLSEFEDVNAAFAKKGMWEQARKGRFDGLHLLASPEKPQENRESLVVDFGQIVTLPVEYLSSHANSYSHRWRLNSPYLEQFSQAFARFFMRVGLPTAISPFK